MTEAHPWAIEANAKFSRKMVPGGHIDQILAGGALRPPPAPPLPDAEIERIKRNIEIQLTEYAEAINAAGKWWQGWKARFRLGFRAQRRQRG